MATFIFAKLFDAPALKGVPYVFDEYQCIFTIKLNVYLQIYIIVYI